MTAKAQAIYDLLHLVINDYADELFKTHGTVAIDLRITTTQADALLLIDHRLSRIVHR